ncbi:MAG TPA: DNA polymerase III subunit chi [Ideonella sp.]|uniref:DNA polymerase III subunit chi n=1 Tax=Ideonella sp. TaxID=1929293 RepID=UPI002E306AE7|nr:DNA polymerase III subunit chi [Ideonella sp.]HEX5683397.1 DNA polymerase III subunit chi [Ideonella sp.]
MAEVVFLTGVADMVDFAGRLLRKKYREGARVAVYAPSPLLQRLDQALWVSEQLDFIPHALLRAGSALPSAVMIERTPLWLLTRPEPALHCDSGINLGCDELDLASVHERVAEVVSLNADDVAAGRARWKRYETQGHQLVHRPQR